MVQQETLQHQHLRFTTSMLQWSLSTHQEKEHDTTSSVDTTSTTLSARLSAINLASVCLLPSDCRVLLEEGLPDLLKDLYVHSRRRLSKALSSPLPDYRGIQEHCQMEDHVWELLLLVARSALRWSNIGAATGGAPMFCGR